MFLTTAIIQYPVRFGSKLVAVLLLTGLLAGGGRAQERVDQQAEAVAQVVLGILSYARWPVEPAELNLCVVGPTEFADSMVLGMVQANGRIVRAQRKAADSAQLGEQCNAVYLGTVSDAERQKVFRALSGHPVLSISERDPSCSVGSAFCLQIGYPKVSFEVNLDAVARSGVRVHPNVLKLAKRRASP